MGGDHPEDEEDFYEEEMEVRFCAAPGGQECSWWAPRAAGNTGEACATEDTWVS
jgi:hypothetical protein